MRVAASAAWTVAHLAACSVVVWAELTGFLKAAHLAALWAALRAGRWAGTLGRHSVALKVDRTADLMVELRVVCSAG